MDSAVDGGPKASRVEDRRGPRLGMAWIGMDMAFSVKHVHLSFQRNTHMNCEDIDVCGVFDVDVIQWQVFDRF